MLENTELQTKQHFFLLYVKTEKSQQVSTEFKQ